MYVLMSALALTSVHPKLYVRHVQRVVTIFVPLDRGLHPRFLYLMIPMTEHKLIHG